MKRALLLIAALTLCRAAAHAQEVYQEVVIHDGDTMWSIANKYLKDPKKWPEIVKFNALSTADPTIALPGTRLKIPLLLIKEEFRTAQLISVIPEVRYRRKEGAEWQEATRDMTLKYDDNLRTMKGAQARVRFPSKEIVQINENSYVVLKPEKILQQIQLLAGDIRASRARVIMPHGTVVEPKAGTSDYQAKVRSDKTEVVFVYKGDVNVTAQGKTVTVREGFGTQVPKSAPPMQPMPLSNFPDFNPAEMAAQPSAKFDSSKGTVKVMPPTAATEDEPHAPHSRALVSKDIMANYKLQISADENFQRVAFEKTEPMGTAFDIKKIPIPDGNYFMRVAFIDALGVMGRFSAPTTIVKDTVPPEITALTPDNGQSFTGPESDCDVLGTVKDAVMISVNDEVVFISPTGRFTKTLFLSEGANKIHVVARDVNGNETVVDRKVFFSRGK